MKKLGIALLMVLFAINVFGQTDNKEFRATWSITWHQFWSSGSVDQLKARTREILDNHKEANMNAVLWHVRQGGTVYYPSSIEPWGSYLGYSDPGYDPLAYAIEEAHKRGMELHAWFNTFATSSTHSGAPAAEHPDWVCRDRSGNAMTSSRALSPGLKDVRNYTVELAMEIVNNYDVDGIHFDYVRWNEYSSASSSIALAKKVEDTDAKMLDGMWTKEDIETLKASYKSTTGSRYLYDVNHPYSSGVPSGYNTWENWWRASTNEFISMLHDSVQDVKPWVKVSVAALGKYKYGGPGGWNGYYVVYQDAGKWFNEGWVDLMTPMHYHWDTGDDIYYHLLSDWGPNITQGINDGRIFSVGPGSYNFSNWDNHPSYVKKIRTINWVDGVHFFSYGSWEDHQYWEEAGETFFSHNTKQKPATFLNSAIPDAPTMTMTKIDSFNYEIQITPAGSVTENQWFVLYRETSNSISRDASDIVGIYFNNTAFKDTITFDGYQNYNGQYYYATTMCDRYWNESALSSAQNTSIIPSYNPKVLSQFPADGDTIEVNKSISLEFSKKMDRGSVESNITILPSSPSVSFSWAHKDWKYGNKELTIKFDEFLPRSTDYTITISGSIQDDCGLTFDGNGDGTGGDDLVINFRTVDEDKTAPEVVNIFPVNSTLDFDVENVITLEFDELVDETTLDTNSMTLLNDGSEVDFDHAIFTQDEISILTLNTYYQFTADVDLQLTLDTTVADTAGNAIADALVYNYHTENKYYDEDDNDDHFNSNNLDWQDPEYSGSTSGTIGSETTFAIRSEVYLPGYSDTKSGRIKYEWDTEYTGDYLLRDYNKGSKKIDTSYTIQIYVYGDGSNNKFRFSCYEYGKDGELTSDVIEVSKWTTIDWKGWKLLEWKLSDPNSVGYWNSTLGNQIMDGEEYRLESVQLTYADDGAVSGTIYIDDLRYVKKTPGQAPTKVENEIIPKEFTIYQNYPNPFNPITNFKFDIVKSDNVKISIYNIKGQKVDVVLNKYMSAGSYEINYDASHLSSGIYLYGIKTNGKQKIRRMTLLK